MMHMFAFSNNSRTIISLVMYISSVATMDSDVIMDCLLFNQAGKRDPAKVPQIVDTSLLARRAGAVPTLSEAGRNRRPGGDSEVLYQASILHIFMYFMHVMTAVVADQGSKACYCFSSSFVCTLNQGTAKVTQQNCRMS